MVGQHLHCEPEVSLQWCGGAACVRIKLGWSAQACAAAASTGARLQASVQFAICSTAECSVEILDPICGCYRVGHIVYKCDLWVDENAVCEECCALHRNGLSGNQGCTYDHT